MNVFFKRALYGLVAVLIFGACSKDDSSDVETATYNLLIKAIDPEGKISDFSTFKYSVINQNTSRKLAGSLDKNGTVQLAVDLGNYDIELVADEVGFGSKKNISIKENLGIEILIEKMVPTVDGLIISELFTAGEGAEDEEGEYIELADQYVVIYNNSNQVKYLDGISYAITNHWNKFPYNNVTEEAMKEQAIFADFVYTFPGTGKDFPIQPGEEKVLVRSARDFSQKGKISNAADLSGAHFEVVLPGNDTDNPGAANMIINGAIRTDMLGYGVGYAPAFLFKQEGDLKEFLAKNAREIDDMFGTKTVFKIPMDIIIDGVETGQVGNVKFKSLLTGIDRGFIAVTDAGTREVYVRGIDANRTDRKVYRDTNNSTADFTIRVGQRNFPAK